MESKPLRILVLSPIEPYPPNGGWAMVVYNDVLNLKAHGHDVHLLASSNNPAADVAEMQKVCRTQYFREHKPTRWKQMLANVGRRLPFSIARYLTPAMMAAAERIVAEQRIDVVLAEDVAMGTYGSALRSRHGVPFFVRGHNVDTQIFERFVAGQRNPLMRLLGRWQKRKLEAYERSILAAADGHSMISEQDAREIRRLFPELQPEVVGAGTDLERFRCSDAPRDESLITHVGNLTAFTKLEAMLWFTREVFPLIRAKQPNARLELAGGAPPGAFDSFDNVTVLGRVPDERPYQWHGRVFIAPQFVGSGVRLKILNAMATGNAIVCTPVACEGIPLVDGEHALIRGDAAGFAEAVLAVLADGDLAARLGSSARRMAEQHYRWDSIVAHLERLLRDIVERGQHS